MSSTCERPRVAVVVSGWPRVSETFAVNELLALRRAGILAAVFATKAGDPTVMQPGAAVLAPLVEVLPETDVDGQVEVVTRRLARTGVDAVHGYFAHQPAAVAAVAAEAIGARFGFSAHALDVRKVSAHDVLRRAAKASVVICCNGDAAGELRAQGVHPTVVRHGVDIGRFVRTAPPDAPVLALVAVGRLVEKKGFEVLVQAMARATRPVALRIVGAGPARDQLARAIDDLGLTDRVELVGRQTHAELPEVYASSDAVVVPSIVDVAGDRDGLPNVVLEAMASGRAVVASDVADIATAVHPGVTGLLVPPGDADALAAAIDDLAADRAAVARLGAAGRSLVEREFELHACGDKLCRLLEASYA